MSKGMIVKYYKKDGSESKGIIRYSEQADVLHSTSKVMIRPCDDNFDVLKDDSGRELVTFKVLAFVRRIGYID